MPTEDLRLGTPDLRALARRAALPAAAAAALVTAVVALGGPLQAFADALHRALEADPRWVAGAAAFELLSFGGYIALLWLVGRRASDRLGLRETAQITLGGAAATRLLPTAGAGGAALTLWALRRSGLGTRDATRTLLTFLVLLYSVFLGSIAATGTLLALEGRSLALTALPAAFAMLGILLPLAAATVRLSGGGRLRTAANVLGESVRDALAHAGSLDVRLLGAVAWWGFDLAVLWAMLHAFGAPPAFEAVVLAYFLGQVGNTVPVPGAVSGGLVGALLAFGVQADLAIVSVLAYRAIAIWVPAPIGLAALGSLRRTMAAWRDDAPAAVDAPALAGAPAVGEAPVLVAAPAVADAPAAGAAAPAPRPRPCEGRQPWRPVEAPVRAAA